MDKVRQQATPRTRKVFLTAIRSILGGFDMASIVERPSAAMEGGGFYNRNSLIVSGEGALRFLIWSGGGGPANCGSGNFALAG
jgi:hypothetical protein